MYAYTVMSRIRELPRSRTVGEDGEGRRFTKAFHYYLLVLFMDVPGCWSGLLATRDRR